MNKQVEFFSPTAKFINFLKDYKRNRTVLELGCGTAPIARRMQGVIPVDLFMQKGQPVNTLLLDASKFPFASSYLAVIARPCHSDWVLNTINAAIKADTEVLYIGLEANIEKDLHGKTKFVRLNPADKNHIVLSIKPSKCMKTFVLLKTSYFTSWMESKDDWFRNEAGGGGRKKDWHDAEILETQEAESFYELDWTKTDLAKRNGKSVHGWITPDGAFWACDYMNHDKVIDLWFKKEVKEVEALGWTRVCGSNIFCYKVLTDAQISTLEKRNYEVPAQMKGHI